MRLQVVGSSPKFQVTLKQVVRVHTTTTYILCYTQLLIKLKKFYIMEQNIKQKVKLIMVEEKPFIVSLDQLKLGDKAIVTVGGQYPSIVECANDTVLNLLLDSRLSLTNAYKIFMEPESLKFTSDQIEKILENDGELEVEIDNGVYKYSL